MTNRNPVKQVFITFPKSNIDKHTLRDFLLQFNPEYYKVVQETHEDGSPHLHAVVKFKNKYSSKHIINKFKDDYPDDYKRFDVKPTRSIKNAIAYLSKEDPNPLTTGEYKDGRDPHANWRNKFARDLGYSSVEDCINHHQEQTRIISKFLTYSHHMEHLHDVSPEKDLPYDILKIRNKINSDPEFFISKDDMTKIFSYYGFSY